MKLGNSGDRPTRVGGGAGHWRVGLIAANYPFLRFANFSDKVIHMTKRSEGFSRLDALIAEHGDEWLLSAFVSRVSDGESPQDVSVGMGLPWFVMRSWLEDSSDRMKEWDLADRCFADGLVYEGLKEVRDCGLEEVPLARLRSESYAKMAAKLNRVKWGEQKQSVVIEGMSMDQALGGFASMLLEKMQIVSVQTNGDEVPTGVVVENEAKNFSAQKFLLGVEEEIEVGDAE